MPSEKSANPIQVLAPDVAARIAAGEVVERAANAAKELIENSLDAGATVIHVEVREGGRRLLRVTDNGAGIHSAEALTVLECHATSKLQRSEQLEEIATFGFRGEALYSIAAVSHLTLQSRTRDEDATTSSGSIQRACTEVTHPCQLLAVPISPFLSAVFAPLRLKIASVIYLRPTFDVGCSNVVRCWMFTLITDHCLLTSG